jgi:hypothetical protein
MTKPTKYQLIAARAWVIAVMIELRKKPVCHKQNSIVIEQTILSLLDNAINPPDLESLKRDDKDANAPIEEMLRNEGWNAAIDHLAPRIVRDGYVVVKKPEQWMINQYKDFKERGEIMRHNEEGIEYLATILAESMISANKED